MAAKYADRFRPTPTTETAATAGTASGRDVLDLGDLSDRPRPPDDHDEDQLGVEPPPGRRWYQSWAARLALVAALLVGCAAGAFGWDRWQAYEVGVAARSEVELTVSALSMSYEDEDEVEIAVRYRNDGEHEVIIRSVQLDSDQVAILGGEASVLTVAPGDTETHLLDLRAACRSETEVLEPPPLTLEVETVDGTISETVVDSYLSSDVVDWFGYVCQSALYTPSFTEIYGEVVSVTPREDGASLRVNVSFGYWEDLDLTIDRVETGSDAFTVTYPADDDGPTSDFVPSITVLFGVGDCVLARQATEEDMSLHVRGAYEDSAPGLITVAPSAGLAVELVRLTDRICPA